MLQMVLDKREQLMIIAIDGTAASGKGTLGRTLAMRLGLDHLDRAALSHGRSGSKQANLDIENASDDAIKALVEYLISQKIWPGTARIRSWRTCLESSSLPLVLLE